MFDVLDKYKNNDHFFFQKGDKLRTVSKGVPNEPGIYLVYKLANGRIELVYIGKTEVEGEKGQLLTDGLKDSINDYHDGVKREAFFNQKIKNEAIDAFDIYWYATFDKKNQDLPTYVQGLILQFHYELHGQLPQWNKLI
ncbi:MAG: hypothetical protein GQ574_13300 [Crocinitomix sp.]|nr:hypothetical protein [Crocinitomix sp.]